MSAPPSVPRWLFDAALPYHRFRGAVDVYGVAVGFAAAGYMAGWEDRTEPAVPALSPRRRAPWRASADRTVRRPR